jgi:hypothetical protein
MHARYSIPAALLLAIASSVSAFAQTTAAPLPRYSLIAIGGAVSRPPTAPVFGVELADDISSHVQVYTTVSYFDNLMRQSVLDDLDATATRLATLTGDPWSFRGRDRGISVVAGAKYVFGGGSIRPYVGGGVGNLNLKRTVSEARIGDVTQTVLNDFKIGEAELVTLEGVNKPLVEFALGVRIGSGRTQFDVGYRYRNAYKLASRLEFSQVAAGIGYRF